MASTTPLRAIDMTRPFHQDRAPWTSGTAMAAWEQDWARRVLEEARTASVLSDMQQINVKHAQCLLRRGPIVQGYTSMSDDDDDDDDDRENVVVEEEDDDEENSESNSEDDEDDDDDEDDEDDEDDDDDEGDEGDEGEDDEDNDLLSKPVRATKTRQRTAYKVGTELGTARRIAICNAMWEASVCSESTGETLRAHDWGGKKPCARFAVNALGARLGASRAGGG